MGNFCFGSKKQKPQREQILNYYYTDTDVKNLVDKWQGSMIGYFKQRFQDVASTGIQYGLERKDFIILFPDLHQLPKKVIDNVFNFFDKDCSGRIDFREFCQSLSIVFYSNLEFQNTLVFQIFDTDEDNYWSKQELKNFIKMMHQYISEGNNQIEDFQQQSQQQGIIEENDNLKVKLNDKKKVKGKKQEQQYLLDIEKHFYKFIQDNKLSIPGNSSVINVQGFRAWALQYFNTKEFLEIFQLVPNPLREREIIRNLFKEHQLCNINQTPQIVSKNDSLMVANTLSLNNNNKKDLFKNMGSGIQNSVINTISEKSENYYVVSWKWWWLWKYYINKSYKQYLLEQQQKGIAYKQRNNKFQNQNELEIQENQDKEYENSNQNNNSSNVSLVDMELNTIPSERKNNQSIVMKMDTVFKMQDKVHGFVTPPGELMQNIQPNQDPNNLFLDPIQQEQQIYNFSTQFVNANNQINQQPQEYNQKKQKNYKSKSHQFTLETQNQQQKQNQNNLNQQNKIHNKKSKLQNYSPYKNEDLESPKFNDLEDNPPQVPNTGDPLKPTKEYSMDNCQVPSDHNENVNTMPTGVENKGSLREQQYYYKKSVQQNRRNKSHLQFSINEQKLQNNNNSNMNSPYQQQSSSFANNVQQTPSNFRNSDIVNFDTQSPYKGNLEQYYEKPNYVHNIHSNDKNNQQNIYTMNQNLENDLVNNNSSFNNIQENQRKNINNYEDQNQNNLSTQQEHTDFNNSNQNNNNNNNNNTRPLPQQIQVVNSNLNLVNQKQKINSHPGDQYSNSKQNNNIQEENNNEAQQNKNNISNQQSPKISIETMKQHFEKGQDQIFINQHNNSNNDKSEIVSGDNLLSGEDDQKDQNQKQNKQDKNKSQNQYITKEENNPMLTSNKLQPQPQNTPETSLNFINQQILNQNINLDNNQEQNDQQNDQNIQNTQNQLVDLEENINQNNQNQQTIQKVKKNSMSNELNSNNKCNEMDINLDMRNSQSIKINLEQEKYQNMEINNNNNQQNYQKENYLNDEQLRNEMQGGEIMNHEANELSQKDKQQKQQTQGEQQNKIEINQQKNNLQERNHQLIISEQTQQLQIRQSIDASPGKISKISRKNSQKQLSNGDLNTGSNFNYEEEDEFKQQTQQKNNNKDSVLDLNLSKKVNFQSPQQQYDLMNESPQNNKNNNSNNNNNNSNNANNNNKDDDNDKDNQQQKNNQENIPKNGDNLNKQELEVINNDNNDIINEDLKKQDSNNQDNQNQANISQVLNKKNENEEENDNNENEQGNDASVFEPNNQHHVCLEGNHSQWFNTEIDDQDLINQKDEDYQQLLQDKEIQQKTIIQHYETYQTIGERPPNIDNYDLEGEFQGELKLNLMQNHDYILLPESIWSHLYKWYRGDPQFKRKRIKYYKSGKQIVELYPPYIQGYLIKSNGHIDYQTKVGKLISSRKTFENLYQKFNKIMKMNIKSTEVKIYYRKLGEAWNFIENWSQRLVDCQIESGTIVVFVNSKLENKFKQIIEDQDQLRERNNQEGNNQYDPTIIEVGDCVDIRHHFTNNQWKLGYLVEINESTNQYRFHFKKETYKNDLVILKQDLECFIGPPHQYSKTQRKMSIDQHQQQGFTPKLLGLANIGNTCFLNNIIQCLIHTPLFREYLLQDGFLSEEGTKKNQIISKLKKDSQILLMQEVSDLAKHLYSKRYNDPLNPFQPYNLKKAIDIEMNQFSGYEQHDAQEFLNFFLDYLLEEQKEIQKILQQMNQPKQSQQSTNNDKEKDKKKKKKEKNPNQNENNNNKEKKENNKEKDKIKESSNENPPKSETQQEEINQNSQNQNINKELNEKNPLQDKQDSKQQNQNPESTQPQQTTNDTDQQKEIQTDTQINNDKQISQQDNSDKEENNNQQNNQNNNNNQQNSESSIIQDLFMGITRNTITCQECGNVNYKYEDFMSISIPIPVVNEQFFEVTFYPRCDKDLIPKPTKYGVKISKYDSIDQFTKAFEKVSGIPESKFVFAEVYRHGIHQNFYFNDKNELVKNLGFRSNDEICCYEILKNSQSLMEERLSLSKFDIRNQKSLTCNLLDFIDVIDSKGKWRYGQIVQIKSVNTRKSSEKSNRHKTSSGSEEYGAQKELQIKVQLQKQGNKEYEWFKLSGNRISGFRTNSVQVEKEPAYLYVISHRRFNQNLNKLEKFGTPLMITIMPWITWKELYLIVYNQVRRFIDFTYLQKKKDAQKFKEIQKNYKAQDDLQLQRMNSAFNTTNQNNVDNYVHQRSQKHRNTTKLSNESHLAFSQNNIESENQENPNQQQNIQQSPQIQNRNLRGYTANPKYKQSLDLESKNQKIKKNLKNSVNVENKNNYKQQMFQQSEVLESEYLQDMTIEQFIQSPEFPYTIKLLDQFSERCVSCDKYINFNKKEKNPQEFCQNCQFGFEDVPLMWNVNNTSNISIVIDWKDSLAFNPFSIVPIPDESSVKIKKEKSISENQIQLKECFNLFSKEENVELVCDKCKIMKEQTIKTQIDTLPNILVIHLKRFYFQQGYLEKLDNFVNCPMKGLSLEPWSTKKSSSNNEPAPLYDLYAVSNHIGNGSGGHYTAYVQVKGEDNAQQNWVQFDDENVSFISQDKIISNQSYLLFYKKRQIQSSTIVNLTFRPIGV